LISWYRQGADVQRLLPHLATYLGHVHIAATQRYLTMTPELLREVSVAVRRLQAVALRDPVMPVADGFFGRFVWIHGAQLRERDRHLAALPTDLHKHIVLAQVFHGHA